MTSPRAKLRDSRRRHLLPNENEFRKMLSNNLVQGFF
jgi:hypothetical protein